MLINNLLKQNDQTPMSTYLQTNLEKFKQTPLTTHVKIPMRTKYQTLDKSNDQKLMNTLEKTPFVQADQSKKNLIRTGIYISIPVLFIVLILTKSIYKGEKSKSSSSSTKKFRTIETSLIEN